MALKSSKVAIEVVIKDIKKIADLKKGLKELRAEQKKQEKESKTGQFQSKKNAKAYKERAAAIKFTSKQLRELNKDMAGTTKATKAATKSTKAATKATKASTKSSNGMAKQFIKGAAAIGIVVGAFRMVSKVVSSVISTFSEFEFVMAKVNAVSGATDDEFKALSESAQELGRTTFFTATQVGELQLAFSKLGFTAAEIQDAQKATLDLATSTGTDLARAAQVAGAAVRGFGLEANETQRVVDVMAVSFASSAMDIEKWQTSMTKVAPIAKSSGFSIEDTAAIMSKLADSGIEASIAGTSLRNILLKMQDPTSDLSKSFGGTIHSLDELVPAMKQFVKEGGSMADVMEVVDLRQAGAFEQMLSTTDVTLKLRDALLNANGEGERMALIVGDTLQGAWLKFKSAIEGVSIVLFSFIAEPFKNMVEGVATFFNNVTLLIEGFDSLNEKIVETAKSFQKEKKATEDLITEYARLDSITEKTKEEKIRFGIVTKELEDNIGDSIKVIDAETGALVLNAKALDVAIARHALLADGEAVKLVHQLNKLKKELDGNNKALGENNTILQQNQDLLDELTTTEQQREVNLKQTGNTQKFLNEQGEEQVTVTGKVNLLNSEQFALTQKIEGLKQKSLTTNLRDNQLKKEESELLKMLNDLGYSNDDINNLTAKSINKVADELKKKNTVTGEVIETQEKDNTLAWVKIRLMKEVLAGTKSLTDAERELRDATIQRAEDELALLPYSILISDTRLELEQKIIDLKLKNIKVTEKAAKVDEKTLEKSVKAYSDLGSSLIEVAGENEKLNGIRKAGEAITRAAAIAESILNLQKAISVVTEGKLTIAKLLGTTATVASTTATGAEAVVDAAAILPAVALGAAKQTKLPFPLNIIAVVATLALIGKIMGKFEKGGIVDDGKKFADGGMVHGASHANGGVKFAVGGRVNELEGGEAVINKRSTAMFRNQLSSMNQAGGGVKFADGGLMSSPQFTEAQFGANNQSAMMGAMGGQRKVVVVEADITDSQSTVSVIQANATF